MLFKGLYRGGFNVDQELSVNRNICIVLNNNICKNGKGGIKGNI